MSRLKRRSPNPRPRGVDVVPEAPHTCRRCPACATETCRVLQDLGMSCEVAWAASQAGAPAPQTAKVHAAA